MSRLIHNPAGIARKGLAAWRLLRHDRALRDILAVYRRQPGLRRAVRLHALLDDLLRLDLVLAARRGTLRSRQPFTVEWEFDPAEGALVAVSARAPAGGGGPAARAEPALAGRRWLPRRSMRSPRGGSGPSCGIMPRWPSRSFAAWVDHAG